MQFQMGRILKFYVIKTKEATMIFDSFAKPLNREHTLVENPFGTNLIGGCLESFSANTFFFVAISA